MLALRRLRCLPHSVPACQTRLLRTKPRPIPSYLRQWNPALHEPRRSTQASPSTTRPRERIDLDELTKPLKPTLPQESSATNRRDDVGENGVSHSIHEVGYDFLRDVDKQDEPGDVEYITFNCRGTSKAATFWLLRLKYLFNEANGRNILAPELQAPLWRAYKTCLGLKPSLPVSFSQRAWDVLWKSQYVDFANMSRRHIHLTQLYDEAMKTMVKKGKFDLDLAGLVAYRLEQKYMAGNQQQALELWKGFRHQYPKAPEFLDTGARLYALEGFPDRALEIMDQLLALEPDWHESVMLVVLRAYTSSQREQHVEEARRLYEAIKTKVGDKGSIEIYDNCLVGFLEARSLPDARQVFRDMVKAGHLDYTGSSQQIEQVLRRLSRLHALATDIYSMSAIALDAIAVLPVAYHGHIFSGWMKYTYLQNAPQVVAQILDLMVERGYEPEAVHFEFLLRALFRTREPDDVHKAESIGWKMVEEARLSPSLADKSAPGTRLLAIKEKLDKASVLGTESSVGVPAANTSTFALLMSHHAERFQWEHVDFLTRQLREAHVAPDCTIMNVLINNKVRQGQFMEAWQIYKTLTGDETHEGSVFPNGESMRCLWKMLQLATNGSANQEGLELPSPRHLLRETLHWWRLVRQRPDAGRFTRGLVGLAENESHRLMLHCFNHYHDLAGALVALHVLRMEFNVYPTKIDAARLRKQIAWVSLHDETDSARRQFSLSNNNAKNMERLKYTYARIRDRKFKELCAWGGMEFPMTEADAGDFELEVISEFVRVILLGSHEPEVVELMIQEAQQAIGVPKLPTGDASAFDLTGESWWSATESTTRPSRRFSGDDAYVWRRFSGDELGRKDE
jgi:tetratricopeptide (TPR) repeat protein